MFEMLSDKLNKALRHISGTAKLTENNTKDALEAVKKALLEADVALDVVKNFVADIKNLSLGQEISTKLSPGQFFIKLVNEQLIKLMGTINEPLNLKAQAPVVILMSGLQGSGKTTTAGKLAKYLQEQFNKTVMLASCDVYRPAAILQLETIASQINANFFPSNSDQDPIEIAKSALLAAKKKMQDVLIIDTTGRLHIDDNMMKEIKAIHAAVNPIETLFVVDSMTGQDAAITAHAFNQSLLLTGVILTKIDGDARGGAALSVRYITGKPIKFLGIGEKLDALEVFYPDRIASRILGMGDILSLIEEIERKVDKEKVDKIAKKLAKGKGFDLEDFRQQLLQLNNMGGMAGMLSKLPGFGAMKNAVKSKINDKHIAHMIAIVNSMTYKERAFPTLIKGSRKLRIAKGAGLEIKDVNNLLKQHTQMQKMTKKLSNKSNMLKMMRGLQGKLPQGMFPTDF